MSVISSHIHSKTLHLRPQLTMAWFQPVWTCPHITDSFWWTIAMRPTVCINMLKKWCMMIYARIYNMLKTRWFFWTLGPCWHLCSSDWTRNSWALPVSLEFVQSSTRFPQTFFTFRLRPSCSWFAKSSNSFAFRSLSPSTVHPCSPWAEHICFFSPVFSRMRSEGSRFTWGSGGEAVFAKFCVCVRNRRQPSATVRVSAVRLSTGASVSGVVPKACQVELWRRSYIGVCRGGVCESDLRRRSYICVCTGRVCESDLCRRSYIGVCRGGVCVSDLWRRSFIVVCRGGVCVSDLWRRSYIGVCRGPVCVSDLCRRSYIGVCRGGVCESDLCRRSYIGVCRGGICERDLFRRSYIGVCRGGVCESDLCRRSYIGVCRGGICERDLFRRSYIGVCRGGVCVSDLCRRSYIGVCRGGVCESDLCRRSYICVRRGGVCESELCPRRVSSKSVIQECQVRSVQYECLQGVSSKKCQVRVSQKKCQARSVLQECPARVSYKSVK